MIEKLFGIGCFSFGFVTIYLSTEVFHPPGLFFQLFHFILALAFMFIGFSCIMRKEKKGRS